MFGKEYFSTAFSVSCIKMAQNARSDLTNSEGATCDTCCFRKNRENAVETFNPQLKETLPCT